MLRNNKPGEQEEIIEPVAGTLSSHVTRVGLEILQGGGGVQLLSTEEAEIFEDLISLAVLINEIKSMTIFLTQG